MSPASEDIKQHNRTEPNRTRKTTISRLFSEHGPQTPSGFLGTIRLFHGPRIDRSMALPCTGEEPTRLSHQHNGDTTAPPRPPPLPAPILPPFLGGVGRGGGGVCKATPSESRRQENRRGYRCQTLGGLLTVPDSIIYRPTVAPDTSVQ